MNTRTHGIRILAILLLILMALAPAGAGSSTGVAHPSSATGIQAFAAQATDVPPTDVPPTDVPPTDVPPTDVPPTDVPPTDVPPTDVPPTDVPPTDVPPTDVPPTDVPPTDVPGDELSSFFITKLFCATIDETAEQPCVGRVPAAEGTTVNFRVTYVDEGWTDIVPVEIEEFEGFTIGSVLYYDAPLGTYRITEIVPAGYDAFGVPLHDGQTVNGASITIELGPVEEEEEAFFVNVPIGQETPGAPTPTLVPGIQPPPVTPTDKEPAGTTPDTATVAVLPATGTGPTTVPTNWMVGVEIGLVALLLAGSIEIQRRTGR